MILRTWHGETHRADGDAYEAFVRDRAAPDYASVDGFLKLMFSRRDEGDVSHFLLVTVWRDEDAVASFAGADPSKAKYYPEDDQFLLGKEDKALNHRVFHEQSR